VDPRAISSMPIARIRRALSELDPIPEAVLGALKADKRVSVRRLAEPAPKKQPRSRRVREVDMLAYERPYWERGVLHVAGVDEAGRGPLAGPVSAAAVILPANVDLVEANLTEVNDSKQLTHEQRSEFLPLIEDRAVAIGIELLDHTQIDTINIFQAAMAGMRGAICKLNPTPEHVLIDGNYPPGSDFPETAIVKGDALSLSIAAASIVAKVTRDRLMIQYAEEYPEYGFEQHKGYATPQHLAALRSHGPCPIHRRSFSVVAECEGIRSDAYWLLKEAIDATESAADLRAVGNAIADQVDRITDADRDLLKQLYRRKMIEHTRRSGDGSATGQRRGAGPPRYDEAPPPDEPYGRMDGSDVPDPQDET
jgi:ribonuclease HII